jgi:hypothetical protein
VYGRLLARQLEVHPLAAQFHQAIDITDAGTARYLVEHDPRSIGHQQSGLAFREADDDAFAGTLAVDGVLRRFDLFLRRTLLARADETRGDEQRQRGAITQHRTGSVLGTNARG